MNNVVHFEMPVNDIERAQKFYKELFGWDIEKAGEMPYWIAKTGECDENNMHKKTGFINGGLMERNSEDPSGSKPVIVIKVDDLNEHLNKIEEAGGKIVMPVKDVGNMGKYARVEDTETNIIGIWQDAK